MRKAVFLRDAVIREQAERKASAQPHFRVCVGGARRWPGERGERLEVGLARPVFADVSARGERLALGTDSEKTRVAPVAREPTKKRPLRKQGVLTGLI